MEILPSIAPMPNWAKEVEMRYQMKPEDRKTLSMQGIVKGFHEYMAKGSRDLDKQKMANLVEKIRILSEEKADYYHSSLFGFIRKVFSSLKTDSQMEIFKNSEKILSKRLDKKLSLDPKFVCDPTTFEELLPRFQQQLDKGKGFDTAAFLRGVKGTSPKVLDANQQILEDAVKFVGEQAKELAHKRNISLEDSYKLLIGVLDSYDDFSDFVHKQKKVFDSQSTFVLRSALLLASQKEGVELQSWMVYTKSGKPDLKDIWTFLGHAKNWVPEAQGAMAKFAETTFIQAKDLAKRHPENRLILLKGGFGAGKTRFGSRWAPGISAPDSGKRVVRKAMESVPHSAAHIQGSHIAYALFNDMIQSVVGTVIYDSSLSFSRDVATYLDKSKKAEKKLVLYDIARHDMARILSILKRDVKGEDPRVPPDFIIRAALQDKLNRTECMKLILEDKIEKGQEHLTPEYHFIAGDAQGWNTEEVMILTPHHLQKMHPEMKKRLELEGIQIEEPTQPDESYKIHLTKSKDELETYFALQFERPVNEIMHELSKEEQKSLQETFSKRKLGLDLSKGSIHDASTFYNALPENIKAVLPKKALEQAFESIKTETRQEFFDSIRSKTSLSYLDLPLRTALIIHQSLQGDPWL